METDKKTCHLFCNILSKQVENDVARLTTHELFLSSDKSGCCTLQKELMQNRIDSGFTDLNFATKSVHDSQEKLVLQQVTVSVVILFKQKSVSSQLATTWFSDSWKVNIQLFLQQT